MPSEKYESDATRAKTRGFGGYIKDRLTNSADFAKPSAPKAVHARDQLMNDLERKAMGPDGTYSEPGNSGSSVNR